MAVRLSRPRILVFSASYLPGYKGGGPIRSIANLVARLGSEFDFWIVTADRDVGDREPYPGIRPDTWTEVGDAHVMYLSPAGQSMAALCRLLRNTNYEVLYLNSFFSPVFSIKPLVLRALGLVPWTPLVLAPRGELCEGALRLKITKKKAYILFARSLRMHRGVIWAATSQEEAEAIRRHLGHKATVIEAPNIPPPHDANHMPVVPATDKAPGLLKVVFLARISPKKNLRGALEVLAGVKGQVEFDIYGPIEDGHYWAECQRVIDTLPGNVVVRYCGPLPHEQVGAVLSQYHLFFLPTLSENFGHGIFEALLAGRPVLISDRTPWRGLTAQGGGWDLSLEHPEAFRAALQKCVEMNAAEFDAMCRRAREYALAYIRDDAAVKLNRALLSFALDSR